MASEILPHYLIKYP